MSNNIWSKILAAQKQMQQPVFDCTNPHFKSKYASLRAVMDSVLPALHEQGLVLTQTLDTRSDGANTTIFIDTHVSDEGGERVLLGIYPVIINGRNDQQIGSAITYGKRYSLASAFARVADEDDDANAAAQKPVKSAHKPVEVVEVNPFVEAKERLWKAVQDYCAQRGGNPRDVSNSVFKDKPADDWTVEELEAKAAEFEGELV